MNKYLLICAAAAMGAAASGHVARASVTVHLSTNFCSYFVITNSGGGLYAAKHFGVVSCASTGVNDAGVLDKGGKVPGNKNSGSVQFADDTFAKAGAGYIGLDVDLG
jgi:hypothetical protein